MAKIGFIHLNFLNCDYTSIIYNIYCERFNLTGENSSKIHNETMVYNCILNKFLKKKIPFFDKKYNDYINIIFY